MFRYAQDAGNGLAYSHPWLAIVGVHIMIKMTSHLAQGNQTRFFKGPGCFLAGDVAESAHGSDSHYDGFLSRLGR